MARIVSALVFSATLSPASVWAWGAYGHEQVNDAAVRLLRTSKRPLTDCFSRNRDYIVRLAITPDYEWKSMFAVYKSLPDDVEGLPHGLLKKKNRFNDGLEHKMHFFEPDAFLGRPLPADALEKLPIGEYSGPLILQYRKLLSVQKNPDHPADLPTFNDVYDNGTAPWRIAQLYDLAVKALKENRVREALFYMGTLGHYAGDVAQPLHTTMNYDGQLSVPPMHGAHSAFETRMLEEQAKKFKLPRAEFDKTKVGWTSFEGTSEGSNGVSRFASQFYRGGHGPVIKREELIREIVKVVLSGAAFADPILNSIREELDKPKTEAPPVTSSSNSKKFKKQARHRHKDKNRMPADDSASADPTPAPNDGPSTVDDGKDDEVTKSIPIAVIRKMIFHQVAHPLSGKMVPLARLANERMAEGATLLARIWDSIYASAGRPVLNSASCPKFSFELKEAVMNYPVPDYIPENQGKAFTMPAAPQ